MKPVSIIFLGSFLTSVLLGQTIVLHPGDNIASVVQNAPPSTTFNLTSGVYRLQQITPRDGDTFIGETATVLSGATILSNFVHQGAQWVAAGQTQQGQVAGSCQPTYPACEYPEDLFFDDKPLKRVASVQNVGTGTWYFDYGKHQIIFADNPAGHLVETSVARSAFAGAAQKVTIKNVIVEKYAVPAQMGAIGDQYPAPVGLFSTQKSG